MKRLTKRDTNGESAMNCSLCRNESIDDQDVYCTSLYCRNRMKDRLAAIEDILGDDYDLDWLLNLVEASDEGRCLIVPKTVRLENGDDVWYVDKENRELEHGTIFFAAYKDGKLDSFSVDFDCGDFDEFSGVAWGKHFFGSEKVAKIALAEVD